MNSFICTLKVTIIKKLIPENVPGTISSRCHVAVGLPSKAFQGNQNYESQAIRRKGGV